MEELVKRLEQLREEYNYTIEFNIMYNFDDEAYVVIFYDYEYDLDTLVPNISKLMIDRNIFAIIDELSNNYIKVKYVDINKRDNE